jgi:hypothetical protein
MTVGGGARRSIWRETGLIPNPIERFKVRVVYVLILLSISFAPASHLYQPVYENEPESSGGIPHKVAVPRREGGGKG